MINLDKTFIFDYDDTLAWNTNYYSTALLEFCNWLYQKLGHKAPHIQTIINLEEEIDMKAVDTMGFSMKRFPTSCKETYRTICEEAGIEPSEEDLQTAYEKGMLAFDEDKYREEGFVEGVEETLDFLIEQEDELILLTKGDVRVQEKKISATNCERWFNNDSMYIVSKKNKKVILGVVGDRDKEKVWHVGNSIRSDVLPALEAGIKMIYIPCETWGWEAEHKGLPTENPNLTTYQTIIEIKENYDKL